MEKRLAILADLLEGVGDNERVPASALRDLRGRRTQVEIAQKSGLPQGFLSDIESGKRSLTLKSAEALGPALDVDPEDLMLAEEIGHLQRQASNGELDPRTVLDMILEIAEASSDDEESDAKGAKDDALEALLIVAKQALSTYQRVREERQLARERGETVVDEEGREVATKGRQRSPTRDAHGRRIDKPHQERRGR